MTAREHHWDSLRAFLMLLGIPYHAAMAYNARVVWDIQSPEKSEFLTFVSGVLVTFRMPAFFIVAGYFAAMMLERKSPVPWLRSRLTRLGIPFLTGLALLAPLQIALIDINGAVTGPMPMALALDKAAEDVTHPGFSWIMHLWFLPALLAYSVLLVLLKPWIRQGPVADKLDVLHARCVARPRAALAILVMVIAAWEMVVYFSHQAMLARNGTLPYLLAHGIDPYLRYVPFFLVGVALRTAPDIRLAFVWRRGWFLPALAALTAILASLLRGRPTVGLELAYNAVDGAAALLVTFVAIGIARRFFDRPDPRIDRIVDASFSIYLLHHPIIYALSTLFLLAAWPPVVEFALVCVATYLLSYAAHRVIRHSPLALFLFNGVSQTRGSVDPQSPQTRITTLR